MDQGRSRWNNVLSFCLQYVVPFVSHTVAAVIGAVITIVFINGNGPPPPPPCEASVQIIANPPIAETNEEVVVVLILSGKTMSHPITYVWSASSDVKKRLPFGPTQITGATWVAPDFPTSAEIRAVAVDATGCSISGGTIVQVVNPNP